MRPANGRGGISPLFYVVLGIGGLLILAGLALVALPAAWRSASAWLAPQPTATLAREILPTPLPWTTTPSSGVVEAVTLTPTSLPATLDPNRLPAPHPRAGISVSSPANVAVWAQRLGASWYLDWNAAEVDGDLGVEHWKMVRLSPRGIHPSRSTIRQLAAREPGSVWIIGNEPDVIWQDNLTPEAYARAYYQLYHLIKESDPTAQVAVAGVSQATPLRLAYLDQVLAIYQADYGSPMPVDWWTVHGFVLREEKGSWGVDIPPGSEAQTGLLYELSDHGSLDYFESQLRAFRAWMAARGYRETPLALTEFGILIPADYGYTDEVVVQYLKDTFALLLAMEDPEMGFPPDDHRLVQRWAWFSLSDPQYPTSNLADLSTDSYTPVGVAYRDFILALEAGGTSGAP